MSGLKRGALVVNKHYQRHGLKAYAKALTKYHFQPTVKGPYKFAKHVEQKGSQSILGRFKHRVGGRAHTKGLSLVKTDATTGQTGDVPAEDVENNSQYLAEVGIGTPAQTLNLDFDTGSADLWVFSTELPADEQSTTGVTHTIFDPSKSSTWALSSGETWTISYGDGSTASGNVGTDNVNLGGIVIKKQAVELAESISSSFVSDTGDGLLGLAFGSINTVKPTAVKTPVENMIAQDDIPSDAELFTAWLGDTDTNSFYTFGYIDQDALGGQTPAYTAIDNSEGFWMFDSPTASVNGKTITRTSGNKAIADTGTTLCLVSDDLCKSIYGAISGAYEDTSQQAWVYPSSATLPTIQLAVGDNLFTLSSEVLAFEDLGNGYIYGGIQSAGDLGFDIFGDVFLRNVYAIFDQGNTRIGMVQRDSTSSTSTTSST